MMNESLGQEAGEGLLDLAFLGGCWESFVLVRALVLPTAAWCG